MVTQCVRRDTYVVCHETMERDDRSYASFESPVCRGFYDKFPGVGQLIRIAQRLGLIEFVDPPVHEEGATQ